MAEKVPVPVLLISHDGLAASLKRASVMIMGDQENIGVIGLEEGDGLSNFITKVQQVISELEGTEKGIIFLVDIPFGTPWNASVAVKREIDHIVAGISLPFFLEVLNYRNQYDEIEKILADSLAIKDQCFRYLGSLGK
jgi:PTS system mannose-specific IIA component